MSNPKIKQKVYYTNMGLFHEIVIISWIKTVYSDTRSFGKNIKWSSWPTNNYKNQVYKVTPRFYKLL